MSQGADVVDAYFAAVTAHDADAVQACFDPAAVIISGARTVTGAQAIADFYRESFRSADLLPTAGPYVVDGERVAVEIEVRMEGQSLAVADFFTVEDGMISRLVVYGGPARLST
jgi:hypothetical protein